MTPKLDRILLHLARALLGRVEPDVAETGFAASFWEVVSGLSPRERRSVRWLLRALQVSPILFLRGRSFTALDREQGERHLARLLASPFGPARRGVAVLKTLVGYAYYGQPESWPAIGYGGPWLGRRDVEVLPEPDVVVTPADGPRDPA